MKKIKEKYLIVIVLIIAAILRLVWLDELPFGVTGDELQQGYTGYSILKTGNDEWGDFLPINPRGFGDYKPPLYSYLTIPFEFFWGLDILAVRLPSALAGIATVLVVYFLTKLIFNSAKIGLLAAFFLSISPWHIFYSRVGFESNIGVLTFALTILFLLKSFQEQKWLILSAIFFGLTLFTYHSFRVFAVLFLICFLIVFWKTLRKFELKNLLISGAICSIGILIVGYGVFFSGSGRRAADAAIYNEENVARLRDIQIKDPLPQPWGRVINNRLQFIFSEFTQNYLGYFSSTFLFSGNRSNSSLFNMPGKGLLYVWDAIFLVAALYFLIRFKPKWYQLLILWLLLAPIPAALTRDYMHAQRAQTLLPILPMLSAYGATMLWGVVKTSYKYLLIPIFIFLVFWALVTRIDHYLFHIFKQDLGGVKYGYQEVIEYIQSIESNYERIIFTKAHSEPHIFVAFYSKMDPLKVQADAQNWKYFEKDGFKFLDMINYSLGKYEFRNIEWNKEREVANALVIADPAEIPADLKAKLVVKGLDNKVKFVVLDTNDYQQSDQ